MLPALVTMSAVVHSFALLSIRNALRHFYLRELFDFSDFCFIQNWGNQLLTNNNYLFIYKNFTYVHNNEIIQTLSFVYNFPLNSA